MTSKTRQLIADNEHRIEMLRKMRKIAEQYGDQYEQERIDRNIAEWQQDSEYLKTEVQS